MRAKSIVRILAAAATLLAAFPAVGADSLKRFGAITVACDATAGCAASVPATTGESLLVLARAAGWRARWIVSVSTGRTLVNRNRAISLSIDNGVDITLEPGADYDAFVHPSSYYILSPSALARLMLQIQRGHTLRFAYIDVAGAPHADSFPIDRLSQALSEIDDRQGHVAGDRRAGPPTDLSPAPEVDEAATIAAEGIPDRLRDLQRGLGECEAEDGPGLADETPLIGALSDTATLYALPCFRADAGLAYRLYTVERGEIGGIHRQIFALWSNAFGWTGADTLYGVVLDAGDTSRLDGDLVDEAGCRLHGRWSWQTTGYRLETLTRVGACKTGGRSGDRLYPPN